MCSAQRSASKDDVMRPPWSELVERRRAAPRRSPPLSQPRTQFLLVNPQMSRQAHTTNAPPPPIPPGAPPQKAPPYPQNLLAGPHFPAPGRKKPPIGLEAQRVSL